jgi:hypothetical protein
MSLDPIAETPEPEGYDVKEVYAFFGLASYCGQVLEKGLVNMVVLFRCKGLVITGAEFESLFDEYDKKTLGQLLHRARNIVKIPTSVDSLLGEALQKRNWLAHQYFADRSVAFTMESGRKNMISELREITKLFKETDAAIEPIYFSVMKKMGITEERLLELMSEMKDDYLKEKRASGN